MTTYAKRKLKYSWNENFNLLHYVEWDRIITVNERNEGYVIVFNETKFITNVMPRSSCYRQK